MRGIEHQINLILGATLPNRVAYRTNPEETKEIQWQVQDLLDHGYVRESLSPCVAPILAGTMFAYLIIHTFQLVFSAGTVFFLTTK